jgi:hypothetical protein
MACRVAPLPLLATLVLSFNLALPVMASAQVTAQVPAGTNPPWTKGIQPISRESYWNAVECGKQGGKNPPCVFYDTDLCKNGDFTLALYTPYKMVAYAVWHAVQQGKEPPTPSYPEAQRTRVVLGVTPVRGSKNRITSVAIRRGGRVVKPATQTLDGSRGTFIFDFAPFAPTARVTLDLVGQERTVSCVLSRRVLARLR